ncbi:MAG: hypothetical protein H6R00_4321 [Proteobacteria bacterium]|nr:hypothetical protein [Pseudomonadota bacterium]
MTPVVTITMLVAAFCGLSRRFIASLIGAFMMAMIGVAHLLARQPASAHHILLHGFHLLLIFNVTYAAFALVSALVL